MTGHESIRVRVGLFVFGGVFCAMVIIFLLGGEKQFFTGRYRLNSFFDEVGGLRVGATIHLAGVRAGMVEEIAFVDGTVEKKIRVVLSINRDFQNMIRGDSVAAIETQGLLGDKIVAVTVGSGERPALQDGETIATEKRPSLFGIGEKAASMMENIDRAAQGMDRLLGELQKGDGLLHSLIYETKERPIAEDTARTVRDLRGASKELREILQKVNRGEGTVGALLTDPSVYHDIRKLFGKMERNKLLRHIIRSRIRDMETEKMTPTPSE